MDKLQSRLNEAFAAMDQRRKVEAVHRMERIAKAHPLRGLSLVVNNGASHSFAKISCGVEDLCCPVLVGGVVERK